MNAVENTTYAFCNPTDLDTSSKVFGRIGKAAIHSLSDVVSYQTIFNCYSSLRHAATRKNYIANEGGEIPFISSPWEADGVSEFFNRIEAGGVAGLVSTAAEIESIRVLRGNLGI